MAEPHYLRENETVSALGDRIVLYYFTTENPSPGNGFSKTTYGIGVEMYTQLPDERTIKERKVIDSVFIDKFEAEQFLDVLCEGCVTPVTLADVVYDYISDEAI